MGWSSGYYDRKSLIEELTKSWTSGANTTHCLKKVTKGNNLWVVLERTTAGTEQTERFIVCIMMRRFAKDEWGYKDVGESSGPGYYTCPLSFFKDVPEPPNDHARQWRSEVIAHARKHQGLKIGDWVILPGCKPRYVKMHEVHPRFRGSGFRIRRNQIGGKVPEMNELEARLDQEFPGNLWRYPNSWTGGTAEEYVAEYPRLIQRLKDFAKANPIGLDPVALQCLGVCPQLADAWIGQENSLGTQQTEAA